MERGVRIDIPLPVSDGKTQGGAFLLCVSPLRFSFAFPGAGNRKGETQGKRKRKRPFAGRSAHREQRCEPFITLRSHELAKWATPRSQCVTWVTRAPWHPTGSDQLRSDRRERRRQASPPYRGTRQAAAARRPHLEHQEEVGIKGLKLNTSVQSICMCQQSTVTRTGSLSPDGLMSLSMSVPSAVPSLTHSSIPLVLFAWK